MSLVGRLEDLSLSDIFQILSIGRKTGTLSIRGEKGSAFIVFKNGLIIRAETNMLAGSIGDDLVKYNLIKQSTLDLAVKVKKKLPHKSVAEIIFELGPVSKDTLDRITKKRIEQVVYYLLLLKSGDFRFELDNIDVSHIGDIGDMGWETIKGMSAEYLLMEGARVHDEALHREMESVGELSDNYNPSQEVCEDWEEQTVPPERKDISALRSLSHELRFPNSLSEITLLILRFASDIFQRGVIFMVNEKAFAGLGQFGLDVERADERIRETMLPYCMSPFLKGISEKMQPFKGTLERDKVTEALVKELDGGWPAKSAFFPIIAEGKTIALLYCDNTPTGEDFPETDGLEIFISQAGLAFEKALLQKRLQELQNKGKS
jgi:Domain of unknown function (DUF4388)